jgi:hypothetical protein
LPYGKSQPQKVDEGNTTKHQHINKNVIAMQHAQQTAYNSETSTETIAAWLLF